MSSVSIQGGQEGARVVLITGGGRGIGLEIGKAFAARGDHLTRRAQQCEHALRRGRSVAIPLTGEDLPLPTRSRELSQVWRVRGLQRRLATQCVVELVGQPVEHEE